MVLFFLMYNKIEHVTNFQVNIFLKFRLKEILTINRKHINCVITLCVIIKNFVEKMKKGRCK